MTSAVHMCHVGRRQPRAPDELFAAVVVEPILARSPRPAALRGWRTPSRPWTAGATARRRSRPSSRWLHLGAPPDRPVVEGSQYPTPRFHVRKAAEPDKPVRVVKIPELTDHAHPDRLLRLQEFSIEQFDELIPPTRVEPVLPQLDDFERIGVRLWDLRGHAVNTAAPYMSRDGRIDRRLRCTPPDSSPSFSSSRPAGV